MLQCGDPTATGAGGPGYRFNDELTGTETYPAGTVAMANSGPNTNGSQFFLVFGDTQLSPDYTVFGTIDAAGIAALKQIAAQGTDDSQGSGSDQRGDCWLSSAKAEITAAGLSAWTQCAARGTTTVRTCGKYRCMRVRSSGR